MTVEDGIVENLINNFEFLDGKCIISREKRIIVEVPQDIFMEVIEYAKLKLSFTMLCMITGLDIDNELQAIYHLANDAGIVLSMKLNVPKSKPVIQSVTGMYQGASLYERELIDMFGFIIKGIPPSHRYPLPDWWPEEQYPLRKDWKQDNLNMAGGISNNG